MNKKAELTPLQIRQIVSQYRQGWSMDEISNLAGYSTDWVQKNIIRPRVQSGELEPRPKGKPKGIKNGMGHSPNYYVKKGNWGGHTRKFSEETRQGILADYFDNEMKWSDLVAKYKVGRQTLWNIIRSDYRYENKRHTLFELDGEFHTFNEWCDIYHIQPQLVRCRISNHKWELKKALETPVREKKKSSN